MNKILLYYKYIALRNPEEVVKEQKDKLLSLNMKGRIIVAKEGINGTAEGSADSCEAYMAWMQSIPDFSGINWKVSEGTSDLSAFPKLSVKLRNEIVSLKLGNEDFSPTEVTGKYLSPAMLNEWFETGKEFYIIDMRNDYEHKVGYFENSVLPALKNFRDLPNLIHDLEKFKNKTVLTVCTGGVRCEKASGYLIKQGFKDVYQLNGGIVSFMEKYPNRRFLGKLYVFDKRTLMGFNVDSPDHTVVGKCDKCGNNSDNYVDCGYKHCKGHRHFICCSNCLAKDGKTYCSTECEAMA